MIALHKESFELFEVTLSEVVFLHRCGLFIVKYERDEFFEHFEIVGFL